MDDAEIYQRLNTVFHSVFFDDSIRVTAGTTAADVPGWDSVANIHLMVAIEGEFGFEFTTEQLESLETVGDIARLAAAKGKAR